MGELADAMRWHGTQPCHECGQPLGQDWTEQYNPQTERLDKVHRHCSERGNK